MKLPNLNLRHLRAFCEVAKHGSISAAAEHVFLSQPAITQALAKLEETLSAPLFVRKSNGMFLTEPGELFQHRAVRALDNLRRGARRAARAAGRGRTGGFQQFDQLLTSAQLRALVAVAQAGNFSLAARAAGVSQPSVHRMARDLERVSGLTLFDKTARGIELTPAAQVLRQFVGLAFSELEQGVDEVDAWRGLDVAHLRIGTLPLARTRVLPSAINGLTRLRPDVSVSVTDGPYDDLLHALRHGEIDVLIGALRDPPPIDDVSQEELFGDELAVIGRRDHPLAGHDAVTPVQMADYPWVVPRRGTPTRDLFEALFEDAGVEPPVRLVESSSLVLIRGLLAGSDRLTLISANQFRIEIEQGLADRLAVALDKPSRPIGLTTRRDWQPTATQALFIDLLRKASAGE